MNYDGDLSFSDGEIAIFEVIYDTLKKELDSILSSIQKTKSNLAFIEERKQRMSILLKINNTAQQSKKNFISKVKEFLSEMITKYDLKFL